MSTDRLEYVVSRLDKPKRIGADKYIARCPAHDDRNPSLAITAGNDGRILFRCWSAGCDIRDILAGAGLTWADVMPPSNFTPTERKAWRDRNEREKLELALEHERLILTLAYARMGPFTQVDAERIVQARSRIKMIVGVLNGE